MDQTLYDQFSAALREIPEGDLLDTIDRTEHAITQACRTASADTVFVPVGITGEAVDRILAVFAGRRVRGIAEAWRRLRGELAGHVARRGADADIVRELREGGPRL